MLQLSVFLCVAHRTILKPGRATWIASLEIASCQSTYQNPASIASIERGFGGRNFQRVKSRAFSCEGGELYGDKGSWLFRTGSS